MNKRMFGSILVAITIAFSAIVMGTSESVAAVQPACQPLQGQLQTQVVAVGETQGTITKGGLLNGTTQDLISNPDPVTGVYTATFRDTTKHGILVTQDTGQSFQDGSFIESGTIDGGASTGKFAGATGSIMFHGSTTDGVNFTATISGTLCRAHD